MATQLSVDYLVVGAGAAGMAFTDALTSHADVSVAVVDRRHGAGGHWLDDYPFVRLHQASAFYGVASTVLGGRVQASGPEAGLHERASAPEVCAYYGQAMNRFTSSGKVSFYPGSDYLGRGRFVSRISGREYLTTGRVVDARYLSPEIPARTPPPFVVHDDARVITVNELVDIADAPSQFVIVGSGKTATDACVWLLGNGVDPGQICWVRPRDPWMLNRAVVQPDPAVFLGVGADTMEAAAKSATPSELFERLEATGIMLRIDESVTPTMAKTPTLARWELELLRSIDNVVRLGHIMAVAPGEVVCTQGTARIARDAVVVHCAASGLQYQPLVPIWRPDAITLQPVRTGFPCFGAAMIGVVEATRDRDIEKNRVCPPSPYSNTPSDWARMQVLGARATAAFSQEPDLKQFANSTTLNPSRIPPGRETDPQVMNVVKRSGEHAEAGLAKLAEFAGITSN